MPAVEVGVKALGVEAAAGLCAHYTDAPGVVQCPVATQHHALGVGLQAGAAPLSGEVALVAHAFGPEVALFGVGQRVQGRKQLAAELMRGVLSRGGEVSVLAARQLFKSGTHSSVCLSEGVGNVVQCLFIFRCQFGVHQIGHRGIQHGSDLQTVVRRGLLDQITVHRRRVDFRHFIPLGILCIVVLQVVGTTSRIGG